MILRGDSMKNKAAENVPRFLAIGFLTPAVLTLGIPALKEIVYEAVAKNMNRPTPGNLVLLFLLDLAFTLALVLLGAFVLRHGSERPVRYAALTAFFVAGILVVVILLVFRLPYLLLTEANQAIIAVSACAYLLFFVVATVNRRRAKERLRRRGAGFNLTEKGRTEET